MVDRNNRIFKGFSNCTLVKLDMATIRTKLRIKMYDKN